MSIRGARVQRDKRPRDVGHADPCTRCRNRQLVCRGLEIEKTRRRGYAVDDEELEEGLRCIAVPLLDAQRQPVAAVSVSGPSFRVTAQKLPSIANHLLQGVRGISMDMGFTAARNTRPVAAWTA